MESREENKSCFCEMLSVNTGLRHNNGLLFHFYLIIEGRCLSAISRLFSQARQGSPHAFDSGGSRQDRPAKSVRRLCMQLPIVISAPPGHSGLLAIRWSTVYNMNTDLYPSFFLMSRGGGNRIVARQDKRARRRIK